MKSRILLSVSSRWCWHRELCGCFRQFVAFNSQSSFIWFCYCWFFVGTRRANESPFFRICNAEGVNISICNAENNDMRLPWYFDKLSNHTTALQPNGGIVGRTHWLKHYRFALLFSQKTLHYYDRFNKTDAKSCS